MHQIIKAAPYSDKTTGMHSSALNGLHEIVKSSHLNMVNDSGSQGQVVQRDL